jgi:hypothetical protein
MLAQNSTSIAGIRAGSAYGLAQALQRTLSKMLRCMSPLLALFGHGAMSNLSPLSAVKRKLDFEAVRSVDDPERTSGPINLRHFSFAAESQSAMLLHASQRA